MALASILRLVTVLDRKFSPPFFNPSRQDVQDLLTALEDLTLPMGSFPSELLHSSGPSELNHNSDIITLPVLTTPAPGNGTHQHDGECLPNKPTLDDGGVKPLATTPLTISTLGNSDSIAIRMPTPGLATLNRNASEPTTKVPTTERELTDADSESAVTRALVASLPEDNESAPSVSLLLRHLAGNVASNTTTVHLLTNTQPDDIQLSNQGILLNEPSLDTSQNQQAPEHDDATREEVQQEQQEDPIAALEKVPTGIQAIGQQDTDTTAAAEEVPTETQTFVNAIRELVDPEGSTASNLETLVKHVAELKQQRTEAGEKLELETVRFQRAERDFRNGWEDSRYYLERVIDGQNEFANETADENHAFWVSERNLKDANERLRDELQTTSNKNRREIARLNAQKEFAENAERTAKEEVEDRMKTQKKAYEKKMADTAFQHLQEQNSLECQKKMVNDSLTTVQNQLATAKRQHQSVVRNKDRTIEELEASIEGMESAVAAAQEREANNKGVLEKQLKDHRTKNDGEISTLKSHLREAKLEVQALNKSLEKAEAAVDSEKLQSQRLSDRLDETTMTLRENNKHVVDGLKLDISGLQRTITDNETTIESLGGEILRLESGEEVQSLRSQLLASQRKWRKSAKDAKEMKEQLQKGQRETEELQQAVQAQEKKSLEDAEAASKKDADVNKQLEEATVVAQKAEKLSKENEDLKEQLKQAARAAEENGNIKARELEEQKDELARQRGLAQSAEESRRGDMERLQNETRAAAVEHERIVREKDDEIRRLHQEHEANTREAGREQEEAAAEKAAREASEGVRLALQKQLDDERQSSRQAQEKAAAEEAAREASEGVRLVLQKQLDDERQSSLQALKKATKTEYNLRNEIGALKSQLNKVAEPQNTDPVSTQSGKEPEEAAALFPQADAATDAQKEAISRREIRKPRSLRQQAKPVSAVLPSAQALSSQPGKSIGQPQQTPIKKDFRSPFADILASVAPPKAPVDTPTAVAPEQAINAPVGWTNDMTEMVKAMEFEDMDFIEETVKAMYGFDTANDEGLKKWLHKLLNDLPA